MRLGFLRKRILCFCKIAGKSKLTSILQRFRKLWICSRRIFSAFPLSAIDRLRQCARDFVSSKGIWKLHMASIGFLEETNFVPNFSISGSVPFRPITQHRVDPAYGPDGRAAAPAGRTGALPCGARLSPRRSGWRAALSGNCWSARYRPGRPRPRPGYSSRRAARYSRPARLRSAGF